MKAHAISLLVTTGLVIGIGGSSAPTRAAADAPDVHVAAAKAAAGQDHLGVFEPLCAATPAPQNRAPTAAAAAGTPDRSVWHAEPAKVFDNLYFVGQTEYSSWAVTTSAGIIVIDTIFD
jgi:metallo-beta-lactamase class B